MKRFATVLALGALTLTACQDAPPPTGHAPEALESRAGEQVSRYIVVFHPGTQNVPALARALAGEHGGAPDFVYQHALQGFAAALPAPAAAALAGHPQVAYVEPDRERHIFAQTVPTGVRRVFADDNTSIGIDGVDDRVDADVAIIDTGVDFEHPDLNVVGGVNCTVGSGGGPPWARTYTCESGGDDDHYHGTHVAGTVAALDNGEGVVGVAPGARIWAVKVLDSSGSGYESMIVAGIDWVAAHGDIEVANMSLGGSGFSQAEYDAIQGAVNNGVAFAVAAGNSDDDASNYSPAAFDNALTVSALADFDGEPGGNGSPTCRTDEDDTLADFSNWGDAVQIAAPGVCILSTFPLEQGEYGTISGTSMASPHAAGALALLASSDPPANATDVENLYAAVIAAGNSDWTDDSGDGTKEPLLDVTGFTPVMVGGGGGNSAPTASFTFSCTELACDFDGSGSSDPDGTISSYDWDFGDGATGTGSTTSHTFAADGTYTVTLTVTDDDGATGSSDQDVTVSSSTSNTPPTASFTFSCTDLGCSFDAGGSSDSDGTISSYDWDFGDGNTGTGETTSHSYAAGGDYTVTLTVTDDGGATDSDSQVASVSEPSTGGISLSATGHKVRGRHTVDLTWSGATSTDVDVFRDGNLLITTANDGAYTDSTNNVGGGSYTYQVCEAGTNTCSETVTVVF